MLPAMSATLSRVLCLMSLFVSVKSINSECRSVTQVFDSPAQAICTKYTKWYTHAAAPIGKTLPLTIQFQDNQCERLYPVFLCSVIAGYCRNSSAPGLDFHIVNPCTSFCNYMVTHCDMGFLKNSCGEYKDDVPPVTQEEFESGSFLNTMLDDQGYQLVENVCIPYYQYPAHPPGGRAESKCTEQGAVPMRRGGNNHFMGSKNCGAPCDKLLFSQSERDLIRKWCLGWALLCFCSCLFTFVTYLLDRARFNYPQVCIIYFALCYVFISLSYICGFLFGNSVACSSDGVVPTPEADLKRDLGSPRSQYDLAVVQGLGQWACTVSFAVLYYFTMASALWWVVLCFTWYLTAGLKWSHEAIATKAFLFHAVVWVSPLLLTSVVLFLQGVEGDDLTGTCFTGTLSTRLTKFGVFFPLLFLLLLGFAFILFGLVSMCRIRSVIKVTFDTKSADSFQKLIVRIGIFSLFYMLPMAVVVACYYYEIASRDSWIRSWQCENFPDECENNEDGKGEPGDEERVQNNSKPEFKIFLCKYFLTLAVGIASLFWVMSHKTINLWLSVFCACTEVGRNSSKKCAQNPTLVNQQELGMQQLGITANPGMLQTTNMSGKDVSPASMDGTGKVSPHSSGSPHQNGSALTNPGGRGSPANNMTGAPGYHSKTYIASGSKSGNHVKGEQYV